VGSGGRRHLRNRAAVLVLLYGSALFAQTVRVPFVGCPSDGQVGPQEAPKGTDKVVHIETGAAKRLAYYEAVSSSGILAPRGWYCFGTLGSSSGVLFVSPQPIKRDDLFSPNWRGIRGPTVEVDNTNGNGSGMYAVAHVLARVFPSQRPYVQGVINSDVEPASDFTFSPYPNDKLILQTKRLVRYRTAPRSEGLGTMNRLEASDDPIDGVAILEGPTPDLLMLRVRLPLKQRDLAPVIIRELLFGKRSDAR
jgi:hypothetical protein